MIARHTVVRVKVPSRFSSIPSTAPNSSVPSSQKMRLPPAPTSSADRARRIASRSQGFVYYISRTGVTGARQELAEGLTEHLAVLRAASSVPVAVGFGISTPEQAASVGALADGVVVGSAVVDTLTRQGVDAASRLVASLRDALGGAPAASTPDAGAPVTTR